MNVSVSDEELKKLIEDSGEQGEESNNEKDSLPTEGFSENELNKMEAKLSKILTPDKTTEAVNILKGFRIGATPKETEDSVVNSFMHYFEKCISFKSMICTKRFYYFRFLEAFDYSSNTY